MSNEGQAPIAEQDHEANRSQPFRRVAIRMSAAAGSGGSRQVSFDVTRLHSMFHYEYRAIPVR
jgi:hypothetical protein